MPETSLEYRSYVITHRHKPVPTDAFDYEFRHESYDGPDDPRCGFAATLDAAKAKIDEQWEEVTPKCYLQEDDPPEQHDLSQYSAVCGQCYTALDEVHKVTIERLITTLSLAHQDIGEWCQLAERQRTEIPQVDFNPIGPSQAGIAKSRRVQQSIGDAIRFARSRGCVSQDAG